jgi:hypothetical protein
VARGRHDGENAGCADVVKAKGEAEAATADLNGRFNSIRIREIHRRATRIFREPWQKSSSTGCSKGIEDSSEDFSVLDERPVSCSAGRQGAVDAVFVNLTMPAKTAFLVNEGAKQPAFDRLAKALQSWKRFALVDDVTHADMIIAIKPPPGLASMYLSITTTADQTVVWGEASGMGWSDSTMVTKLVERLRQRLEAPAR